MASKPPFVIIPPSSPDGSMYTLLLDPPLPRFIAWVPVVCRGLAIFIAVPFILIILLDIVAYMIARTLHLRPLIMRVPRSPPSGSGSIKPQQSPGEESEVLPVVSEGELSPVLSLKKLAVDTTGDVEKKEGMGGALGLGLEERVDGMPLKAEGALGLDVRGEEEASMEASVLVRPPTPTEHQEDITQNNNSTEYIEPDHILTEEPQEKEAVTLAAPIPVPLHIEGVSPREVVSPTPTLGDELDTDARYGIDAMLDDSQAKREESGDLADDALAGWTGGGKKAVGVDGGREGMIGEDTEVDELNGAQAEEERRAFEPVKGKSGEPDVHLGEWEPTDFSAKFKKPGENTGTDEALKDLGEKLAQEDERTGDGEKIREAEEGAKLDLTVEELQDLLRRAQEQKLEGNNLFQSAEPDLDGAIGAYRSALDLLPVTSLTPEPEPAPSRNDSHKVPDDESVLPDQSGVMELTDEQAEAIKRADEAREAEARRKAEEENDPEIKLKREVEREIEETKKAVWGNLGAVWVKKGDDKEAVSACTEALKLDPSYVKVLQRRALASERIGSWSSLTTAQEDYTSLTQLLPKSSPLYQQAQRALITLPGRIRTQQEKEKDEMLSKLKDLGDGLLGRFGLSTNNFKFDKQEGGGYSMRFER